jgi:hypothetical protein
MSEYVKACSTCKKEIRMSNNTGKWLPSNLDGSAHRCFEKGNTNGATPSKTSVKIGSISLEDLDLRLKMVEMILLSLRSENMP